MKTLKDKMWSEFGKGDLLAEGEDVKEFLTKFYEAYWKESKEGDKGKNYISCDELDYLMDKYFGSLVKIETLQDLENQEK